MSTKSNWVSTPAQFARQDRVSDTLTTKQLTASGSLWTLGHLKVYKVLVTQNPTNETHHLLFDYIGPAEAQLAAHGPVFNTLREFGLGANFCLPSHQICSKLEARELSNYYSSLATVCAPTGIQFDDSYSASESESSSTGDQDVGEDGRGRRRFHG